MKKILASMRRAINDFGLIRDGDRIAVGLSGGKDSLCLLKALSAYRVFSPEKFELTAITVDMGYEECREGLQKLTEFCKSVDVPHVIIPSQIAEIVFSVRKEPNPCSLCAKLRRGALNSAAKDLGCNKVALGHHADDVTETFFLSLFYEGRLSTFMPSTYLDKTDVTVIRPFYYSSEADINGVANRYSLPVLHNPCPANHHTAREQMKDLMKSVCRDIPFAKDRVETAIFHPERNNLLDGFFRNKSDFPREK